jgi:hypothetical protein
MAGLAASVTSILPEGSRRPIVLGFPALKGGEFLADDATRLLRKCADPGSVIAAQAIFSLETAFHLGGYGKTPPELLAFMQTFPPPVPHLSTLPHHSCSASPRSALQILRTDSCEIGPCVYVKNDIRSAYLSQ